MASKFFAVVAGVGPGTGRSVALRFAREYPVVLLARRPESYEDVVKEVESAGGRALGISTDTSDPASVKAAFAKIKDELPDQKLAAAVFNASAGFAIKPFLELELKELQDALRGNADGIFNFAQAVLPGLLASVDDAPHPPTLIVTGATASLRGGARFASFASSKFAVRAITQSLAREFGPQGVHVAHAIIDSVIDTPRTKHYNVNDNKPDGKTDPDAIAESYWQLHAQHRSAFTQELDIRPYVEKF